MLEWWISFWGAGQFASRLVTLPLYPSLTMAQLDTVVAAIYASLRQESRNPIK